ncbi:hypothetical protein [Fredinandcohnia onubensis]|uniref:hypothetical protein n=1 Tax=Fredinandcohnia onubensis TaxID=1571209 RepID=UPI0015D46EBA|nr:hypothetical protein [Fredinandcohnia onubensis]
MIKLIYKAKYYWHSFQFSKNRALLEDCLCQNLKSTIEMKMYYHKRAANNYITKL